MYLFQLYHPLTLSRPHLIYIPPCIYFNQPRYEVLGAERQYLHSTMYLFQQNSEDDRTKYIILFTFHHVSISTLIVKISTTFQILFTFHHVSISTIFSTF